VEGAPGVSVRRISRTRPEPRAPRVSRSGAVRHAVAARRSALDHAALGLRPGRPLTQSLRLWVGSSRRSAPATVAGGPWPGASGSGGVPARGFNHAAGPSCWVVSRRCGSFFALGPVARVGPLTPEPSAWVGSSRRGQGSAPGNGGLWPGACGSGGPRTPEPSAWVGSSRRSRGSAPGNRGPWPNTVGTGSRVAAVGGRRRRVSKRTRSRPRNAR
jgi:hypothetical protein